jgi:hypothetical protein
MTRDTSRRSVLAGTGAAAAGLLAVGSNVSADGHDVPVVIESVTPREDLIVLRNEGDSDVDLSGYVIRWLYNNPDNTQEDALPEDTVIEAGGTLRITSGFYDTEADVTYDYGNGRINNDGTNTIALLTPSQQEEVSVYEGDGSGAEGDDPVDDEPEEEPEDDDPVSQDVEFEYSYQSEVPDEELDDRLELSSAEYFLEETDADERSCYITFDVENLTDDEEMTVYLVSSVENDDGEHQSSHEYPTVSEPGSSMSVDLSFPECIDADRGEVHAMVTSIETVEDEPGGDEPESYDVDFEYEYDAEIPDRGDVDLESKLELSSAEFFRVEHDDAQDYCYVDVKAENLTDDTELSLEYGAVIDEEMTSIGATGHLDAGETSTARIELYDCDDPDPEEGVVSAFASNMSVDGEEDEEPDDDPEDEPEEDDEYEDDSETGDHEDEEEYDDHDETEEQHDDDCPEEEPEPEPEDDCPEEEPEPEPEDDC